MALQGVFEARPIVRVKQAFARRFAFVNVWAVESNAPSPIGMGRAPSLARGISERAPLDAVGNIYRIPGHSPEVFFHGVEPQHAARVEPTGVGASL